MFYKTLLTGKDRLKRSTRHIPWLHTTLLTGYSWYRRHFVPDIFSAIEIETTSECNLRCQYCPVSVQPRGKHLMPEDVFRKIIDDLAAVRYRGRIHPNWFGEPLLDARLPTLVAYARQRVPLADIRMYTNGILLTLDLFLELLDAGVDSFLITQHTAAMPENMRAVLAYLEEHPELRPRVEYRAFETQDVLRNRGGLITNAATQGMRNKCKALGQMDINYKGDVALCCDDYFSSVVFGNAAEESVVDIWRKPEYTTARQRLSKGVPVYAICRKCNMLGDA